MEDNNEVVKDILEEIQKDVLNTELIQDNKILFTFNNQIHRVRLSNQKENSEANNYKNKKFVQLIKEKDTLTIKQLTKVLKENQDIDIEELDKQIKDFEKELTQVYLSLNKKKDNEEKAIEKLKAKLNDVRDKRIEVVLEKVGYLSSAIENQVQDDYLRFLTSICTEKLIDEKKDEWQPAWKSFDIYSKDKTKLPYFALRDFSKLVYGC